MLCYLRYLYLRWGINPRVNTGIGHGRFLSVPYGRLPVITDIIACGYNGTLGLPVFSMAEILPRGLRTVIHKGSHPGIHAPRGLG